MDRRKYLKTLAVGSLGAGVLANACSPSTTESTETTNATNAAAGPNRTPAEIEAYKKTVSTVFFDDHEMKTITVLADIIIPRDATSGSASDAGVPAFIEFIVKDMPYHQLPMRGGLKWLDRQCTLEFGNNFIDLSDDQRTSIVDRIAFPEKAAPGMESGVAFFNRMRDLTATGFFTSEMGIKDLGYVGNVVNQWDGVPNDVLAQYGLAYDERTLKESVKFDS